MIYQDSAEYRERLSKPYTPTSVTLKEIHEAVPKHLLRKDAVRSTLYVLRDIVLTLFLYKFAASISGWEQGNFGGLVTLGWLKMTLKAGLWVTYWWFQGLLMAGIFCLGHDAGHSSLYNDNRVNNVVGFIIHSYILVPYFAWRSTHHGHHRGSGHMERDEIYVPYTRSSFNLPQEDSATASDYEEILAETPFVISTRMFIMQFLGWWAYITKNTMGSPVYPPGTNHFNPDSALFKPRQRNSIIISNVTLVSVFIALMSIKTSVFVKYYFIPYFLMNHWIVMFTYLQHSDPSLPHFRQGQWSFLRGAVATVDRPFLGWMGRFFLHNISHDHVAHHFFSQAPFYNGPEITKAIKKVLKDDYCYDSTASVNRLDNVKPAFYALYRTFTQCVFVEDEGDIIFYKNSQGKASRNVHDTATKSDVRKVLEEEHKIEGDVLPDQPPTRIVDDSKVCN